MHRSWNTTPGALMIALVLMASPLAGCGEDASGGPGGNNGGDTNNGGETNNGDPSDVGANNGGDPSDVSTNNSASPDVSDGADVAPDTAGEDVAADVPTEDVHVSTTCQAPEDCSGNTTCIDGVCTLNPEGRAYVEYNYVLQEPEELTTVVSVLKGFLAGTGFFMTAFSARAEDDTMMVTYGGGDRVMAVPDGYDQYAWQFPPDTLPAFQVSRYADPNDPLQDAVWESEVFDYRLVAVFEFMDVRSEVGFVAKSATVQLRFSEDLDRIEDGVLEGYITREESESRFLNLNDPNCFLTLGVCPSFDCANDPPLQTLADVLDCNGAVLDADIDPDIEGHDAYRAVIYFQSNRVEIQP